MTTEEEAKASKIKAEAMVKANKLTGA